MLSHHCFLSARVSFISYAAWGWLFSCVDTELTPDSFFSLELHLFESTSSAHLHPEAYYSNASLLRWLTDDALVQYITTAQS